MGLVVALYVASMGSFSFPHVVAVSALSIDSVLGAFHFVLSFFCM